MATKTPSTVRTVSDRPWYSSAGRGELVLTVQDVHDQVSRTNSIFELPGFDIRRCAGPFEGTSQHSIDGDAGASKIEFVLDTVIVDIRTRPGTRFLGPVKNTKDGSEDGPDGRRRLRRHRPRSDTKIFEGN